MPPKRKKCLLVVILNRILVSTNQPIKATTKILPCHLNNIIMSQSLLDMHLRSAIATHKNIVSTSEGKKGKSGVQSTKKNKEKNFLDEARKQIQGKKQRVNTILKTLGEEGNTKKFSKRRLKSIIKVHRSNK